MPSVATVKTPRLRLIQVFMGSHCMGPGRFHYSNSDFECEYHSRGELSTGFQVSNVLDGEKKQDLWRCGVVAQDPNPVSGVLSGYGHVCRALTTHP